MSEARGLLWFVTESASVAMVSFGGGESSIGVRLGAASVLSVCAMRAAAQVVAGVDTASVPMQVYDRIAPGYVATIPVGVPVRGLAADDARRIFYISTGPALYRVSYDPPRTPELIGAFSGATLGLSGGLAWDSSRDRLYATTTSSFYEVNVQTAATTLVRALPAGDFGGLDYDPVADRLIAANDSTATAGGLQGRGIYTITPPYDSGPITRIAPYPEKSPGVEETDVDGLAVGDGRVFLCTDEPLWMYAWNLASQQYEAPVAQSGFTGDRGYCGAAWAPGLLRADPFDVRVSMSGPADCTLVTGQVLSFASVVSNPGSAGVTGVTAAFQLPGASAFISSDPPGSLQGSVLRVALGAMGPGSQRALTVSVRALEPGVLACRVDVALDQPDPVPLNNTRTVTVAVGAPVAQSGHATALLSTVASSPSSLVPGMGGARFSSATASLGRPFPSPAGTRWIMWSDTDTPDASTDGVLVAWDGAALSVVAREGVFPSLPTAGGPFPALVIDPVQAINDAGVWAFSGLDARASTIADGFVARVSGAGVQVIAQEDTTPAPAFGSEVFFGGMRGSVSLRADGLLAFATSLSGPGVSAVTDAALVGEDGARVLARKGVTVPGDQQDGFGTPTSYTIRSLDFGSAGTGFSADGWGSRFSASGAINASTVTPPPGGVDRVAMTGQAGGAARVLVQENVTYPGAPGPALDTSPFSYLHTDARGRTVCIMQCADGTDLVLVDGAAIASTGGTIADGEPETWDDASWGPCFFLAGVNARGDAAVGAFTSSADPLRNTAVVLNGRGVVVRENDPVDLDGDGRFDEEVHIAGFVPYRGFLTNDALVCVVRLRSRASATGCAPDAEIGQALIRVPLDSVCPPCPADFNNSGGVPDDADVSAFFAAWSVGAACADTNQSGGTPDDADVSYFFDRWNAGC